MTNSFFIIKLIFLNMKNLNFAKSFVVGLMLLAGTSSVSAQEKTNIFGLGNRVGIGVGLGTEGIGIDAAVPLTKYVQARVGLNIFPSVTIKTDANVAVDDEQDIESEMRVKGRFSRTTLDLKFDCYPFGNSSSFFVTAGFSVGGNKLVKITGHSDDLKAAIAQGKELGLEIGDYRIPVDENGDVSGGVKVKSFRPYLGLGFGRLIPKKRFGMRFELGAQFQGTPVVYADGIDDIRKVVDQDTDDDISKVMDYLKVYPVLKLSFRGRIL